LLQPSGDCLMLYESILQIGPINIIFFQEREAAIDQFAAGLMLCNELDGSRTDILYLHFFSSAGLRS
jgi:hypothetical protein